MSISLFQAFLLGIVYYLGIIGTPWTTVLGSASLFQKPLVAGTLVGIILGHPTEGVIIGAAIQLPYGLLGTLIWVLHMTIDVTFVHMADQAAEKGDLKRICFLHVVPPQILVFLISVIPVMLGAYYGADFMADLVSKLSNNVLHILQVIGGILPALGVAMNLRSISRPNTMAFYILGFILSVYLGLDTIVISVLGFVIAWFYTQSQKENV